MNDLGPLAPCEFGDRHRLAVIVADDSTITALCRACGAARRLPAAGPIAPEAPLDDMDVNEIERRIYGRNPS